MWTSESPAISEIYCQSFEFRMGTKNVQEVEAQAFMDTLQKLKKYICKLQSELCIKICNNSSGHVTWFLLCVVESHYSDIL